MDELQELYEHLLRSSSKGQYGMLRKKNGNLEWLEFELLADDPRIVHGVFLRCGGVSTDRLASLNVSTSCGDTSENVQENLKRISNAMQLPTLFSARQVHGTDIFHLKNVGEDPCFLPFDGLMTNQNHAGLLTSHADCQAAIFYDPIHQAIGTVHAGWRGQVKNIYYQMIQKMKQTFHSNPNDLLVCISPSLGPDHSEFKNYRKEFPEEFWPFQFKPFYFDLWAIAQYQLEKCGILPHHIEIARIDTFSSHLDFYSYRREKPVTGRHGTVIAIMPTS